MELQLTEAQETKLNEIASHNGKSVNDLLVQAAASLVQSEQDHWAAIDRALEQAERGEFIEEEEMDERVAKMLAR